MLIGVSLDANSEINESFSTQGYETSSRNDGISFQCESTPLSLIKLDMEDYLTQLGIKLSLTTVAENEFEKILTFSLNTPNNDSDTLGLMYREEYTIKESMVYIPNKNHGKQSILTVSKKEILLSMLQHGRNTVFSGKNCNIKALKDVVDVRQNIVAWSENLDWRWPDGEPARWNKKFWNKGTPKSNVSLHMALNDIFKNQKKYAIGCYVAAKIVMVQGVLDYYSRIKKNKSAQSAIEANLMSDGEPLVNIEPSEMWSFEPGYYLQTHTDKGKILNIQRNIASDNFVPGDWVYIVNTDTVSSEKTGYEGSNAIYLGRNKFSDFYNDNNHAYSYREKLDEVYQWRNHVFSRSRDSIKIKPLSSDDYDRLGKSPDEGGIVQNFRVFPMIF